MIRTLICAAALVLATAAEAREFTTLHAFAGPDGATPQPGLSADAQGNLYGVTSAGGTADKGTIFKLAPDGTRTTVFDFASRHGAVNPLTALLVTRDGGFAGVAKRSDGQDGVAIYKVSPAGHESVLATIDGGSAIAGLSEDADSTLYGTTTGNGFAQCGTAFRLHGHTLKTLYTFQGGAADGCSPSSPLVIRADGSLIGTTSGGGGFFYPGGNGTFFKLTPDGHETLLHLFSGVGGSLDGARPYGALLSDAEGNVYGTTYYGDHDNAPGGTIYRYTADGHYRVLHFFGDDLSGDKEQGSYPLGGLARDAAGNLYGSTQWGGPAGVGVVFKLTPRGKLNVLQWFYGANGALPAGSMLVDTQGNLFGTTPTGGSHNLGTVFEIAKH